MIIIRGIDMPNKGTMHLAIYPDGEVYDDESLDINAIGYAEEWEHEDE